MSHKAQVIFQNGEKVHSAVKSRLSDRATNKQDYHDVKEVLGAGQQQVRNIWTNLAVYNLNLWMHTLVELWAWNKSHSQ